jgi:hypothetical protein
MYVSKDRPTPEKFYIRVAMMISRFGHLPGFRQPALGKHAGGRDPKPLLLESMLHRLDPAEAPLPRREYSKRGLRKRTAQAHADKVVRLQREHRAACATARSLGNPEPTWWEWLNETHPGEMVV